MIYKIPKKPPIYHRKMLRSGSFPEFFTDLLKRHRDKDRKEEELLYVTKLPRLF